MYLDIISIVVGMLMITGCVLWNITNKASKDCLIASIVALLIGLVLVASGVVFYCIKS